VIWPADTVLLEYEAAIAKLVLSCVIEATPQLGRPPSRGFLAAVLAGSVRGDVTASDSHRLRTFGSLNSHGAGQVLEWTDTLIQRGYLEVIQGRRAIVLTAKGRALIEGQLGTTEPIGLIVGVVNAQRLDLAIRAGLVEALRRYRAELAATEEVPEYRLISEATLREIATRRPVTENDLGSVPGLGPKKIADYGWALLRIVAEHEPIVARLESADRERKAVS
jgi:ATP-dependent DNA helicase RecQ